MPITKASLGIHGEHLLADKDGNVPAEGDVASNLNWGTGLHPGHPDETEHPIRYESWDHYRSCCLTAQTRAANESS